MNHINSKLPVNSKSLRWLFLFAIVILSLATTSASSANSAKNENNDCPIGEMIAEGGFDRIEEKSRLANKYVRLASRSTLYKENKNYLLKNHHSLVLVMKDAYVTQWGGDDFFSVFVSIEGTAVKDLGLNSFVQFIFREGKTTPMYSSMFIMDSVKKTKNVSTEIVINAAPLLKLTTNIKGNVIEEIVYDHPDVKLTPPQSGGVTNTRDGFWGCFGECISGHALAVAVTGALYGVCKYLCPFAMFGVVIPCAVCVGIAVGSTAAFAITCLDECI